MKKILILTAAFMLCYMSMVNAQTLSFRSRALGTIIDDDLDLIYDPIELKFVKGSRLYTNLSNITSTGEQIFDNISDNEYLIGFSTPNPWVENLWNAILIQFDNSETSFPVWIDSDLNGNPDSFGFGTLGTEFTLYDDTSGNGVYDIHRMISQEESDFSKTCSYRFILNNTYDLGSLVVGGKLTIGNTSTDNRYDYELLDVHHIIVENYDDYIDSELTDDNFTTDNSYMNIMASVFSPDISGYEVRGDLQVSITDMTNELNNKTTKQSEEFDPDITDYEKTLIEEDTENDIFSQRGTEVLLGGSIRKTLVQANERKNDGYWKAGMAVGFGSYDYENSNKDIESSIETFFDGLDTLNTDYIKEITETTITKDDGTLSSFRYILQGKINYPLDEKVYFGIGGKIDYNSSKQETDYEENVENIEDYEITDEEATAGDYVITETYGIKADRTVEKYTTQLRFPVGIEYKFTNNNKWDARFGAVFTNQFTTINDAKQITEADPFITETVYGDGAVDIEIEDNEYKSTTTQTKTKFSRTDYYYGLGFKPTDRLQIDLLGFFSNDYSTLQDFIQGLRLSFTLLLK